MLAQHSGDALLIPGFNFLVSWCLLLYSRNSKKFSKVLMSFYSEAHKAGLMTLVSILLPHA